MTLNTTISKNMVNVNGLTIQSKCRDSQNGCFKKNETVYFLDVIYQNYSLKNTIDGKRTFQDEKNKFIRKVIFINIYESYSRAASQMTNS